MALDLRDRIAGKLRNLVGPNLPLGQHCATTLAIASSKGGVGKTTTAVNLAVTCARRGVKTLLVDLDPQAHVSASLGLDGRRNASGQTLSDVLLGRLREVAQVAAPIEENLDLAGSDKTLAETEMILAAKIGKELILADALQITRSHYDLILFDCPPNLGTLTLNALCAADKLLVPSDMSVLALEGVSDILATVQTLRTRLGRKLEVCGIVATRFDRRATQINSTIEQSFADLHGSLLLNTRIPQSSALNKAHMAGQSVLDYARRSTGALAYADLAEELAGHLGVALAEPAVAPAQSAKVGARK